MDVMLKVHFKLTKYIRGLPLLYLSHADADINNAIETFIYLFSVYSAVIVLTF